MRQNLLIALAGLLAIATVGVGLVEGRLSNRWGEPADLAAAGSALDGVPSRVGDWEMVSSEPFADDVAQMLQCAGHFTRVYRNLITDEQVNVALLVGPPGPTAVHTPEICYSSRDHQINEPRAAVQVRPQTDPDESFWKLSFRSNDVERSLLRVYYGWRAADGAWQASENPRFEYGGQSLLYKIQLSDRTLTEGVTDGDACSRFLQDFLPAVDTALFKNQDK